MEGFVTDPGFERALCEELVLAGLTVDETVAGLVVARGAVPAGLDPAFALQRLPACTRVVDTSAARLAKAAFDVIAEPLDRCDHWTLHAYPLPRHADSSAPPLGGRASLVKDAFLDLLRRLRRRTDRRRIAAEALTQQQADDPTLTLVQLLLVDRDAALVSVAPLTKFPTFGVDPEPRWPGAVPPIDDDRGAPSSAYRKAEEAFARLGRAPAQGERVVDLGGSPGGWTWTALKRGARVLAIDRAPLEPPVHGHPLLEERQADAFKFEPDVTDGPRDWLLCDVIAAPERTLALLDRWLAEGWCRRFVVNVKFKGEDRGAALAALRELLARHGARARVKHLSHDKNEVTAFGMAAAR